MVKKILIAMSGGIDSSVAAFMLKKQGYYVAGATFNLLEPKTSRTEYSHANKSSEIVCNFLNIKHYEFDLKKEFKRHVIENFVREYLNGRTPNPCIVCNKNIKFSHLIKIARSMHFDYVATGHYARIEKDTPFELKLKKGVDDKKEQSYFLYKLTQDELHYVIFPLGEYTKEYVKKIAKINNLPITKRPESQEICFIKNNYSDFIKSYSKLSKERIKPGIIKDNNGKILGTHQGIACYTIGQRSGLGISYKHPLYVTRVDLQRNILYVGNKNETYSNTALVKNPSWVSMKPPKFPFKCDVKIRYLHKQAPAVLSFQNNVIKVEFENPQESVTPGQSAVFYEGNYLLGGGIITLQEK